jgi:hypothetical protein
MTASLKLPAAGAMMKTLIVGIAPTLLQVRTIAVSFLDLGSTKALRSSPVCVLLAFMPAFSSLYAKV